MSASSAQALAPRHAPHGRPLLWHLAAYGLVLATAVLALAGGLGWTYVKGERERLLRTAADAAASAAAALDRDLGGLVDAIEVLALSPPLRAGDLEAFDAIAREVRDALGVNVVLRDPEGNQLVNARLPRGAPLPRAQVRDTDAAVLASGKADLSNIVTGAVTRAPLFIVSMAVKREGRTDYLLDLSPSPARVAATISRTAVPPGWTIEVADRNGTLLARAPGTEAVTGRSLPPETLALIGPQPQGRWGAAAGGGSIGAWRRTEIGGWPVLASAPAAVVEAPLRRVLASGVALAALLAALVAALAWAFARGVAAPIKRLAAIARAADGAALAAGPVGPVQEVNALAEALSGAWRSMRERGRELAGVLEATSDGVIALDPSWRIIFMNRRAMELVASGRDLTGQLMWDAFPDAVGGAFWHAYARCMEDRVPTEAEERYAPLGRTYAGRAFPSAAGGITLFFHDVTEERAAAARLAESEARLRAILDNVPVGVVLVEAPDGRVVLGNRRIEAMLRHPVLPSPSIEAYRDWEAYHPDGRRLEPADYPGARALAGEEAPALDVRYRRGDGTFAWIRITAAPIRGADGAVLGAVAALADVDAERRTLAALAESEAQLRQQAERVRLALDAGAIVGTWDWDLARDRLTVDERFAESFGLDPALGRGGVALEQVLANVHPDDLPGLRARIAEAVACGGSCSHQARVRGRDGGYRWIEANGRVEHGPDGTPLRFPGVLLDIGARRAAEEERDRAGALLRTFAEAVPGVVYAKDREGRVLVANEGTAAVVGKPLAAILGRTDAEFLDDPAGAAAIMAVDRRIMETGSAEQVEEAMRLPDGTPAVWLSTKAPLRDARGAVVGLVGSSVDITARKRAEEALARREAQLRATHDAAPVGLALVAADFRFLEVNDRLAAINGVPAADHVGRTPCEILPPGIAATVEAVYRRVLETGEPVLDVEFRGALASAPDEERDWLAGYVPVRGADGAVVGVGCAVQDVTTRKAAERAAREGEARWRSLAEALPQLVWTCASDGACDYFNPRWEAYTGVRAVEHLGHRWLEVVHPADRQRLASAWKVAVAGEGEFDLEVRLRRADGAYRWFKHRAVPLRAPDGRVLQWFGTSTDVTDAVAAREVLAREAAELERLAEARGRALAQSEARLAQAAKMEALGRLAGGLAHDFNNVLQAVQGGVTLAARRLPADVDGARRFLGLAKEAAGRGAAVTGRLLSFARRGELKAEPVEPAPLLAGLADMLRPALGPDVALRVEVPPGTPPVLADRGQLEAVLVNLANNARDAMPRGGAIVLGAAPATVPGAREAPADLAPGTWLRLTVADDGEGMAPEVLARVTEPFFTTKPKGRGTGLGLAMARGFAEQSGGALSIRSAPGQGTTVCVWLPVATGAAQAPAAGDAAPPPGGAAAPGMSVLLVDDEAGVRAVLAAELADRGYAVTTGADAAEALAIIDDGLRADALVTDLAMPGGMDGLALITAVRTRRPGLPAVLVTGHVGDAAPGELEAAERGGPFALLRKPVTADVLAARLAEVARLPAEAGDRL